MPQQDWLCYANEHGATDRPQDGQTGVIKVTLPPSAVPPPDMPKQDMPKLDMKTKDVESRLIDLETRAAHYERMADDLSEVIAKQSEMLTMLTARIKRLSERLGEVETGWGPSPQDQKPPPHY